MQGKAACKLQAHCHRRDVDGVASKAPKLSNKTATSPVHALILLPFFPSFLHPTVKHVFWTFERHSVIYPSRTFAKILCELSSPPVAYQNRRLRVYCSFYT